VCWLYEIDVFGVFREHDQRRPCHLRVFRVVGVIQGKTQLGGVVSGDVAKGERCQIAGCELPDAMATGQVALLVVVILQREAKIGRIGMGRSIPSVNVWGIAAELVVEPSGHTPCEVLEVFQDAHHVWTPWKWRK
jgi:hypothetical protein